MQISLQVARQEGEYLAQLFQGHYVTPEGDLPQDAKPFQYNHKGSAAYVGAGAGAALGSSEHAW